MFHYFLLFLLALSNLLSAEVIVLVSVAPYSGMVERLTDKQVAVQLLVPAGFSSHTYEPTPRAILQASKAKLWFTIGELFEKRIIKALQSENPNLTVVDLRQGLDLMKEDHDHHHDHDCSAADPHIWMSPKMMQVQVNLMAKSLQVVFPELKSAIEKNRALLQEQLETLDRDIHEILKNKKGEVVLVSHPSYGYFCREYGLVQVSIEFEGKDPTPKELYKLLEFAKKNHITTIFTQRQYSTKASELIAKEIDAKIVLLDPYSANYFESMRQIAHSFAEG
jgi:zinc transport system substrate-binding protein